MPFVAWRGVARHSVLKKKRKPLCAFAALARLPAGTPAGVSSRMNDYRLQYLYRTVLYCLVPAGCRIVAKLTPLRSTSTSSSPPHPDRYFYGRRYYCITFMLCMTGRASHSSLCPAAAGPRTTVSTIMQHFTSPISTLFLFSILQWGVGYDSAVTQ